MMHAKLDPAALRRLMAARPRTGRRLPPPRRLAAPAPLVRNNYLVIPRSLYGFDYEDLEGSPNIKFDVTNGITATRSIKVPGDAVGLVIDQFTPAPGNYFATFPGIRSLWVDTLDVKPFPGARILPGPPDSAVYEHIQIDISYKTPQFSQNTGSGSDRSKDNSPKEGGDPQGNNTDVLLSYKLAIGGEFMLLPNTGLEWERLYIKETDLYVADSDADAAKASRKVTSDTQAGMIIPTTEFTVTWHRVQFPPWKAIRNSIGYINSRLFLGCNPGTLLFLGCDAHIDFTQANSTQWWTLDYKFSYKNNKRTKDGNGLLGGLIDKGWNYFYRPDSGRFEPLRTTGKYGKVYPPFSPGNPNPTPKDVLLTPGVPIYDSIDLRALFLPGT